MVCIPFLQGITVETPAVDDGFQVSYLSWNSFIVSTQSRFHEEARLRRCEGHRPVAIQMASRLALPLRRAESPYGLPRRCAPRNDGVGAKRAREGLNRSFPPLLSVPCREGVIKVHGFWGSPEDEKPHAQPGTRPFWPHAGWKSALLEGLSYQRGGEQVSTSTRLAKPRYDLMIVGGLSCSGSGSPSGRVARSAG